MNGVKIKLNQDEIFALQIQLTACIELLSKNQPDITLAVMAKEIHQKLQEKEFQRHMAKKPKVSVRFSEAQTAALDFLLSVQTTVKSMNTYYNTVICTVQTECNKYLTNITTYTTDETIQEVKKIEAA